MLSTRLLYRIEAHADELATSVMRRLQGNENLAHFQSLSEAELYDRVWNLLSHLSEWLTERTEGRIRERYEELGRQRFHESVLAMQITKDRVIAFARSEGFSDTFLELYGREELELRVSHFFDRGIYYLVRGYEQAGNHQIHVTS
jgi:dsDNA-binding SOS-regulon protein